MDTLKHPAHTDRRLVDRIREQKLFDAEMRLSILQTKLGEAIRDRDRAVRRKQPTRMIETVIEILRGDIARELRHLGTLRAP